MNFILGGILVVLVLILGVLTKFLLLRKAGERPVVIQESKSLEDIARIFREEHNDKEREKQDQILTEYANSKLKNVPHQMRSSSDQSNRPVDVKGRSNELVPFNWNESQKKIWEEFNNS